MQVTDSPAVSPEPKQAFFIIRVRLARLLTAKPEGDEKRLTLHVQRHGPDCEDTEALKALAFARLQQTLPEYTVIDYASTQVTRSTYETAKLLQFGKKTLTLNEARDIHAEYQIVPSALSPNFFRVVAPNGDESALYTKAECEEIVRLAKEGALLGSFGSGPDVDA